MIKEKEGQTRDILNLKNFLRESGLELVKKNTSKFRKLSKGSLNNDNSIIFIEETHFEVRDPMKLN